MVDVFTKEKRSWVMSRIRSKWTTQEKRIHNYLKSRRIKHKMHPKISGSPDIIIPDKKIAIFLHGCFWHRCPKHYREPKSNREYWIPKIDKNAERDKKNIRLLKKSGWKVVRIWEHDTVKNLEECVEEILDCLKK
jgi:DNA mismatch endonuclease (patch repair protein)